MTVIKLAGIAVTGIIAAALLKKHAPEFTVPVEIGVGICLILSLREEIRTVISFFTQLMSFSGTSDKYLTVLLSSLGIALISQLAANTAKDAGLSSLAAKVELAGQLLIILGALPVIKALTQVITELIKNT